MLENLFAMESTYGHSGGKIETRAKAIAGISDDKFICIDIVVAIST
jgi:hypothetical protein